MQTVSVQVHWGLVETIAMKLQYLGNRPTQVTNKGGSIVWSLTAGQIFRFPGKSHAYILV